MAMPKMMFPLKLIVMPTVMVTVLAMAMQMISGRTAVDRKMTSTPA